MSATASSVPVSTSRISFVGRTEVYGAGWDGVVTTRLVTDAKCG
jgi:hypothetical protein